LKRRNRLFRCYPAEITAFRASEEARLLPVMKAE
jgi:hypothetical protein